MEDGLNWLHSSFPAFLAHGSLLLFVQQFECNCSSLNHHFTTNFCLLSPFHHPKKALITITTSPSISPLKMSALMPSVLGPPGLASLCWLWGVYFAILGHMFDYISRESFEIVFCNFLVFGKHITCTYSQLLVLSFASLVGPPSLTISVKKIFIF